MGLDKWLKPEDDDKELNKERNPVKKVKKGRDEQAKKKFSENQSIKLVKYTLVCKNAKCKYQKVIVKKQITAKDKTCPRCDSEMKIKER
ncbi:MAG: hypothetical protein ACFE9J_14235 [Candidatus Hermodarchaeota archaeon]